MKHAVRRKDKLCRIGFRQSQKSLETVSLRPFIAGSGPGVTIPRRTPPRILPRLKTLSPPKLADNEDPGRTSPIAVWPSFPRGGFSALARAAAFFGLVQTLDYGGHDDRQPHGPGHEDLAKPSAFRRGHELAPGDCLAIGTA